MTKTGDTARAPLVAALLLLTALLLPAIARADSAQMSVSVDPEVVELGEAFQYTITLSVEGAEQLRLDREPDLRPFSLLGRTQMPQYAIINGRARRSLTIIYNLRARRTGELSIAPPVATVGDKRLEGEARTVRVVEQGKAPRQGAAVKQDKLFIALNLTPQGRKPYVGEQITLDYHLYRDAHLSSAQLHPPDDLRLDDFWVEELQDKTTGVRQLVREGSRMLERALLRRYALFPLRAGATEIEPMRMTIVEGGFMSAPREQRIESDPIKLDIQPLPPGAPGGFDEGNVGQWDFRVMASTLRTRVGQPLTISVVARGFGQPGRLRLPELGELEGARLDGSEDKIQTDRQSAKVGGTKARVISLTPTRAGQLVIPALSFVYFDPEQGVYQTKRSDALTINVGEGELLMEAAPAPPAARRTGTERADASSALRAELRGLRRDLSAPAASAQRAGAPAERPLYWGAMLLAVLGIVWLLIGARVIDALQRRRATPARRRKRAAQQALAALQAAHQLAAGERYEAAHDALGAYLGEAWALPSGAITPGELPARLRPQGVDAQLAARAGELVGECYRARFASTASQDADSSALMLEHAQALVRELEDARKRASSSSAGAHVAQVLLCLGFGLALGAPAQSQAQLPPQSLSQAPQTQAQAHNMQGASGAVISSAPANPSDERIAAAIKAHDAGDFVKAAKQWEALLEQTPNDPTLLYHYALSLTLADELPRARLALERARLYEPRARDIAHNLDVVTRLIQTRAMERVRGRAQRVGEDDALGGWDLARRLPPAALAWMLLATLWVALLVLLLRRRFEGSAWRDYLSMLAFMALLYAVVCAIGWTAREHIMSTTTPLIIMAEQPIVREGPSPHAAPRVSATTLIPGQRLRALEQREGWVKINLADGTSGWLSRDQIALVE